MVRPTPKYITKNFVHILIILFSMALISCCGNNEQSEHFSTRWPHEKSDLKPDPRVVCGRFANGFRYVLLKNNVPKNRVSMHLVVQAGSLNEKDHQKGVAHFLEHMLFRGSTHFPPGELVKYFQNIGMRFGPDVNAYTGFFETVYDVLLPNGDKSSLEKGLLVLQDYAESALLLPKEIEAERKVVLSEKRDRDSSAYRTFVSNLNFELPGTRISERLPIGSEKIIEKADQRLLKEFYDTWYRPEKMILVMVGDFSEQEAIPLLDEKFSILTARAPPEKEPGMGRFDHQDTKVFYHYEKESGNTALSIEVLKQINPMNDSKDLRIERLKNNIADKIIRNRLNELLGKSESPFTSADINSGVYLREIEYAEITADCSPVNWQKTLIMIEQILRTALVHGFTEEELQRVKQESLSNLEDAVNKAATINSQHLKDKIINSLRLNKVFTSPEQNRELLAPVIEELNREDVQEAFRNRWSADHRLILVSGNADLSSAETAPEIQILNVYLKSAETAVEKPEELKPVVFPYLPVPVNPGKIINRVDHDDLGITQIDFKNGVRLNLKLTDFKDNEILAMIAFGTGRSGEPKNLSGISVLSEKVINESGLGSLDKEEVRRSLAGKTTAFHFGIEESRFILKGSTVPDEVPLLFQLFYTALNDPGYRPEAYALVMERMRQEYLSLSRTINGAMTLHGNRFLAEGDSRFGLPPYEGFKKLTLDDIRRFTEDAFADAPLEISVVGDFDADAVIDAVSRYMGSLPERKGFQKQKPLESPSFPIGEKLDVKVETEIPQGKVVIAYPTEDIWNIRNTRRLSVLGDVISERMRVKIREKLGAAYSAYAYNSPSSAYPGYGKFIMTANVDPAATHLIAAEARNIVRHLLEEGIGGDELKRAVNPNLTSIKDLLRKNDYWLNTVMTGSREHPEQLEWSRTILSTYRGITVDELNDLAIRYLDNEKAAVITIRPAAM